MAINGNGAVKTMDKAANGVLTEKKCVKVTYKKSLFSSVKSLLFIA